MSYFIFSKFSMSPSPSYSTLARAAVHFLDKTRSALEMFTTYWADQFNSICQMVLDVFRSISKLEVFRSIIILNAIHMVDNLVFFKVTPKLFFHYNSVFKHITLRITKWVIFCFNKLVSLGNITSIPSPMLFSFSAQREFNSSSFGCFFSKHSLSGFFSRFLAPNHTHPFMEVI